jgi:signal recognition particle receptor subunit alpha
VKGDEQERKRKRKEANVQDDKVGAALSMTYVTGQPILFVGCGQTYTDLRHLRVNHIVQALLS